MSLVPMAGTSKAPDLGGPGQLQAANDAIWGQRSLLERFGQKTFRKLVSKEAA